MSAKNARFILAVVIFLSLNHACAPLNMSDEAVNDAVQGGILFSDDFSDPPSGWGLGNRPGDIVEYIDGGLRFQVEDTYYDSWSVVGKNFGDVQIEVDARKLGGPDDNNFGIICRYVDKNNFYMLVVSNDGYYGSTKLKDGAYSMIGMEQLQYSDVILPGQEINHLRVDCVGETLRLYVNDVKLIEVQDPDFSSGDVGLIAGAYQQKGVDILFDQFVVKMPGD